MLLTTGATERNSKMNIYDLAGNVWEWTLEKITGTDDYPYPCTVRGGFCNYDGSGTPASSRDDVSTSSSYYNVGFRSALY